MLAQQQVDGKVHPIARSLNPAEQKYTITELETLGLVWAVRLFRPYILGHRCIVYTDHAACTSLGACQGYFPLGGGAASLGSTPAQS